MKNRKIFAVIIIIVLAIVLFIWNDSLYDKKPAYPIEKERVVNMWLDCADGSNLILSESDRDSVLDAVNSLALESDEQWREKLERNDDPFMSEKELYVLTILFDTDFLHRVDYTIWCFYEDGRVMMNTVSGMRPYPYWHKANDYNHLKLDRTTSDTYNDLLHLLGKLSGEYLVIETQPDDTVKDIVSKFIYKRYTVDLVEQLKETQNTDSTVIDWGIYQISEDQTVVTGWVRYGIESYMWDSADIRTESTIQATGEFERKCDQFILKKDDDGPWTGVVTKTE